jgi:hypothetical protein
MGTPLTPLTISSSYAGLLKTTDNAAINGTLRTITDGMGNDSAFKLSTTGIQSTGDTTTQELIVTDDASVASDLSVGGTLGVGGTATVSGRFTTGGGLVSTASATPYNSPGVGFPGYLAPTGTIHWDADYVYVCIAQDGGGGGTWKRAALSTF